jgi:hypothetical protein
MQARATRWVPRDHGGCRGDDHANVAEVVDGMLAGGALQHLRAAQGVVGLTDKHGAGRLDTACAGAADVGDPGYRTIKGILVAGTETDITDAAR